MAHYVGSDRDDMFEDVCLVVRMCAIWNTFWIALLDPFLCVWNLYGWWLLFERRCSGKNNIFVFLHIYVNFRFKRMISIAYSMSTGNGFYSWEERQEVRNLLCKIFMRPYYTNKMTWITKLRCYSGIISLYIGSAICIYNSIP